MRRIALAAFAFCAAAAGSARASDIAVKLDEVRTITFGVPVATVYVGNPSIADINMIDSKHAFVLGKGYGSTNIVALNHDGAQVSNTRVNVLANSNSGSVVTLNRGADRETYSCTPSHCELTPQPGDGGKPATDASSELTAHQDNAKKAATQQ